MGIDFWATYQPVKPTGFESLLKKKVEAMLKILELSFNGQIHYLNFKECIFPLGSKA